MTKNYSSEFCALELTQKFSIDAKPGETTLLSGSLEKVGKEHQPLNHWVPLDAQARSHNLPVSLQAKRSNRDRAATMSTSWPLLPLRDMEGSHSQDRSLKPCKHYLPSGQQESWEWSNTTIQPWRKALCDKGLPTDCKHNRGTRLRGPQCCCYPGLWM